MGRVIALIAMCHFPQENGTSLECPKLHLSNTTIPQGSY